jgi:hypothetical protein
MMLTHITETVHHTSISRRDDGVVDITALTGNQKQVEKTFQASIWLAVLFRLRLQ